MTVIDDLKRADAAYYNTGEQLMVDHEYDALKDRARVEFPHDPYFSTVGSPVEESGHLQKVPLQMHMGSQNKATTVDEIATWYARGEGQILISEKLDGSSIELTYANGKLIRAATRGDGVTGLDVTLNAVKWSGIPLTLLSDDTLVVRGEAILYKDAWEKHFSRGTANPRNAGNGIVSRKSDDDNSNSHIRFVAFDAAIADEDHGKQSDKLAYLSSIGFNVVKWVLAGSVSHAKVIMDGYVIDRPNLPYAIDGLVLSFNSLMVCDSLGYSDGGTKPRGQIAWKFESQAAETTVVGFVESQGQTGQIIPTMKVEPVSIGGVIITSVLVNNFNFIADHNVNVGDKVIVSRQGDVIPYLLSVVKKNSTGCYQPPVKCPSCGGELVVTGRYHICPDDDCSGRVFQRVKNWVTKTGILFIGDSLLSVLFSSGLVSDIDELYGLSISDIRGLKVGEGVLGESMAEKVVAQIKATRELPIETFMGSLGIKFLGRSMAKHIGYRTVEAYLDATVSDLSSKENMGENKAAMMLESIQKRRWLITKLLSVVSIKEPPVVEVKESPLTGKSFVFTGIRMKPEEKARFDAAGCIEKSGVSASVNYLVTKDAASTSNKAEKARQLGITIIGYDGFVKLLNT